MIKVETFLFSNTETINEEITQFLQDKTFISSAVTYANSQILVLVYYKENL